jgi:hypothetical protein
MPKRTGHSKGFKQEKKYECITNNVANWLFFCSQVKLPQPQTPLPSPLIGPIPPSFFVCRAIAGFKA